MRRDSDYNRSSKSGGRKSGLAQLPKLIRHTNGHGVMERWRWQREKVSRLLLPNLQASSVEIFLREFAKFHGLSKQKIAILLWDGAPAHRAQLEVPAGIQLVRIPPQTPELNPSERLWTPLREAVANRTFEQIEEMEDVLLNGMRNLSEQKEYLSGMTNYHWLPSP